MVKPNIDPEIFRKYNVKIAYLFGSRAKNFHTPKSDVDIAVLFNEGGESTDLFKQSLKLAAELSGNFPHEVDVRVLNDANSLFRYEVISANLPLYSASEKERIDYEVLSVKEYIDDQHFRDIYHKAVMDKISRGEFQ